MDVFCQPRPRLIERQGQCHPLALPPLGSRHRFSRDAMALVVTFFLTLFIQACSGAPDVTEALLLIIPEAQQLGLTDLARLARMVLTVGMLPVMTTFLKFCEWRIDRAQRRASRGSGDTTSITTIITRSTTTSTAALTWTCAL